MEIESTVISINTGIFHNVQTQPVSTTFESLAMQT
jgi:hypothetical protein